MDEYGGTAGIVTLEDLVEELVGDIRDEYDTDEGDTTRHLTGDLEVDGLLNLDDFYDETGIHLPEGPYETVAGFIVNELGHVPEEGESVAFDGHRLEVTELDGRRIARVRVSPPTAGPGAREDPDDEGTGRGDDQGEERHAAPDPDADSAGAHPDPDRDPDRGPERAPSGRQGAVGQWWKATG
jgi:putative hemolysin